MAGGSGGGDPSVYPGSTLKLNASLSSSIYSDDVDTVQPPSFKVRWKTRFK